MEGRRRDQEWENQRKFPTKSQLPNIPDEIILVVLSMLPVKSLLRFRCVSKLWRSSISDPKFTLSSQSRRRRLVISSHAYLDSLHSIAIDDDDDQGLGSTAAKLHVPWNNDSLFIAPRVWGSYDGLLLIRYLKNVYLWNPSTREYKKLFKNLCPKRVIYGLCYDSSTNDYKVVLGDGVEGIHYISVLSLKSQCWKKVLLPDEYVPLRNLGPLVNGSLHWKMAKKRETIDAIIYFDPVKDEFGEVPITPPKNRVENRILGLGELDGCLAMTRQENDFDFKVLAMKKYGVEETWTTLFKFSSFGRMKHPYYKLEPLCITKDGEVLMLIAREEIVAYNPKEKSHRSVMILRKCYGITTVFTYVESLINLARGF